MTRHAYLITAYNNFYVLERLIRLLDDERNDIYVHIDGKVVGFDFERFSRLCNRSTLTFVPSVRVYWGQYSQVRSVFRLFRTAVPSGYAYYHLLSGSDLPIKTQDQIHEFFGINHGREFIHFADEYPSEWVTQIHLPDRYFVSSRPVVRRARNYVRKGVRVALELFRREGAVPDLEIKYGSDWYSVTHEFAEHLLAHEAVVERLLKFARIPTEFYAQTLAWNSRFKSRVSDTSMGNMRVIDWDRRSSGSSPYVFRSADFDELVSSDRMFARKFDAEVDIDVVDRIFASLAR